MRIFAAGVFVLCIVTRLEPARAQELREGTITGRVTDAVTGEGVAGASVVVEGTRFGTITSAAGTYRIGSVPVATHRIVVTAGGYARIAREAAVAGGATAVVNVELSREGIALDEIVVTGAMVETRVRELPSPITVITANDIARLGISRPDELFRGAIAGATTFDEGPNNYYASVTMRGKNSLYFDYIKTYIDGIEVTDPLYIATIDPASIERVEVLRGPQATTMYGAGASGGVMQIFTKKGQPTPRPTIQLRSAAGFISGRWNNGESVGQAENTVTVSGGTDDVTYAMGGSHATTGAYVPDGDSKNYSVFGALRTQHGPLRVGISGRYYRKNFGWPQNPILRALGYAPWQAPAYEQDFVHQKSLGANVSYALTPAWTHNVTLGYDSNNFESYTYERRLATPADTFYRVSYIPGERLSARYHTSLQTRVGDAVAATFVGGIDHDEYSAGGFDTSRSRQPWGASSGNGTLYHLRSSNTGYFAQGSFGISDRVFLTTGVRVESNDNLGDEYGHAVAPRAGIAYVTRLGDIDVKARGAWGKGIKAPTAEHEAGFTMSGLRVLPNPDIGPEEIRGWDAGVEFAFRDRGSLAITYYDQVADGLIEMVMLGDSAGTMIRQYQNVGVISNTGWELEGEVYLRPLPITVRGTLTTMRSIMDERVPEYGGDIDAGESMLEVPEYTAGISVSYARARGAVSLSATRLGSWVGYDWKGLYGFYYGGADYRGSMREYWLDYDPVTKFGLNATYALTSMLQAEMQIRNLTNATGERQNTNTDLPRSIMFGVRLSY